MPSNRNLPKGRGAPCLRGNRSGRVAVSNIRTGLTSTAEPTADQAVGSRSDRGVRATGRFMSCGSAPGMRRVWKRVAPRMTGDQSLDEAPGLVALNTRGSGFDAPRAKDGVTSARIRSSPPIRIDRGPDRHAVARPGLRRAVRERLGAQGGTRPQPLHLVQRHTVGTRVAGVGSPDATILGGPTRSTGWPHDVRRPAPHAGARAATCSAAPRQTGTVGTRHPVRDHSSRGRAQVAASMPSPAYRETFAKPWRAAHGDAQPVAPRGSWRCIVRPSPRN